MATHHSFDITTWNTSANQRRACGSIFADDYSYPIILGYVQSDDQPTYYEARQQVWKRLVAYGVAHG